MNRQEFENKLKQIRRRNRLNNKIEEVLAWSIIGAIGAMLGLILVGEFLLRV